MFRPTKKPFKHSTTFYRRKSKLKDLWEISNQDPGLVQQSRTSEIPRLSSSIRENSCVRSVYTNKVPVESIPNFCEAREIYVDHDQSVFEETDHILNVLEIEHQSDSEGDIHVVLTNEQKKEVLRNWLISNKITHKATNELLNILTKVYNVNNLPKDARTFLRTPVDKNKRIRKLGNGEYWHNGVKTCLKAALHDIKDAEVTVHLSFNIDGLPVYKSSKEEFWPILARIDNMPKIKPMVIGIYSGVGKPPCNDFLMQFVDELNDCIQNGIVVNECSIAVKILCFICDTPARSFAKGKIHSIQITSKLLRHTDLDSV